MYFVHELAFVGHIEHQMHFDLFFLYLAKIMEDRNHLLRFDLGCLPKITFNFKFIDLRSIFIQFVSFIENIVLFHIWCHD